MNRLSGLAIALPLLLVAQLSIPAALAKGPSLSHVEDFHSTTWRNHALTTAEWDTVAGSLSLQAFDPLTVGSVWDLGQVTDVDVSGAVACVTSLDEGLFVYDIADPTHPRIMATMPLDGAAYAVAIAGTRAYVAAGAGGLAIFDLAYPAETRLLGTYLTADDARDVAVAGTTAFVAASGAGLTVLDVADPHLPLLRAEAAAHDRALGVVVSGDNAFVADFRAGLTTFDISDPDHPVLVATVATATSTVGIAINGDLLAVAAGTGGVRLFDVSTPAAPTAAGVIETPGSATAVTFRNFMLLTTTMAATLQADDVRNPAQPQRKWTRTTTGPARGLCTVGDLALVANDQAGVELVRISEPLAPPVAVAVYAGTILHSPRAVALSGDLAFVVTEPAGLLAIDLPVHGLSALLGTAATPGNAVDVAVSGDLVCVADSLAGLRTFDVSDPANPVALGGYDTPGQALAVAISGDIAIVADGTGGLQVIDVTDPASPVRRSALNLPGVANAVAVSGTLACVTDGGLRLVDISNPDTPVLLGSWTDFGGGTASGVAVAGTIACVTAGAAGVYVFDIRNPALPDLVSSLPAIASYLPYRAPTIEGTRLTVLAAGGTYSSSRFRVFDLSDPAAPALVLHHDIYSYAVNDIAMHGDMLVKIDGMDAPNSVGVISGLALAQYDVGGALSATAVSVNVLPDLPHIVCVRLAATQSGDVSWKLNADGTFRSIAPSPTWRDVDRAGFGLTWRADLSWYLTNPSATRLELEWRLREARIDSVVDVPGDQGGWANLWFTASGYDIQAARSITGYNVYRRLTDKDLARRVRGAKSAAGMIDGTSPAEVTVDGVNYVVNDAAAKDAPPGVWSVVSSFWATGQDRYVVTVPTVADDGPGGPAWTSFYVVAIRGSSGSFYASVPDSGRSVDNIAPGVPAGVTAAYTAAGVTLSWSEAMDDDFQYFRVYCGETPEFTPEPANLVGVTAARTFTDAAPSPWGRHYLVTTIDHAGNESEPSAPAATSDAHDSALPTAWRLRGAEPNPFNAGTTIRWEVPVGDAAIELAIYDARGGRVRTLVSGVLTAGRYSQRWDGRDDRGRALATGVYFCRLATADITRVIKLSLLQ